MNIRTPEGFGKLTVRERVVASAVLDIVYWLEHLDDYITVEARDVAMNYIEADVIKLAKLFY